jgi:hypothetical protein
MINIHAERVVLEHVDSGTGVVQLSKEKKRRSSSNNGSCSSSSNVSIYFLPVYGGYQFICRQFISFLMTRFTWPEFGYPTPLLGDFAAKMQDRALLPVRGTVRGRQNAAKFYFR